MKYILLILFFAACQPAEPKLYWSNADSLNWDAMPKISLPVTTHHNVKGVSSKGESHGITFRSDTTEFSFDNISSEYKTKENIFDIYITDSTSVYITINGEQYFIYIHPPKQER